MKKLMMLLFLLSVSLVAYSQLTPDSTYKMLKGAGFNDNEAMIYTRVSIVESGWNYESRRAKEKYDIFGFEFCDCQFKNQTESVNYFIRWIKTRQFTANDPYILLQINGFNPNPNYYEYLRKINWYPKK